MSMPIPSPVPIVVEGFPNYEEMTEETGPTFYVFVVVYSLLSFLLIAPLAIWGRQQEKERQAALARAGFYNHQNEFNGIIVEEEPQHHQQEQQHLQQQQLQYQQYPQDPLMQPPATLVPHQITQASTQYIHRQSLPLPQFQQQQQQQARYHPQPHPVPPPHQLRQSQQNQLKTTQHPSTVHDPLEQQSDPRLVPQVPDSKLARPPHSQRPGLQQHQQTQQQRRPSSLKRLFQEIDRLATTNYLDDDPDFLSQASRNQSSAQSSQITSQQPPAQGLTHQNSQQALSQQPSNANSNANISAATTSRLYQNNRRRQRAAPVGVIIPRTMVLDVTAHRWRHRKPIGRIHVMQQAIQAETESMGGSSVGERKALTRPSMRRRRQNSGWASRSSQASSSSRHIRGMSDVASSILTDDLEEAQQRRIQMIANARRRRHRRRSSFSTNSSSLPEVNADDISPHDAADANDPGRANSFEHVEELEISVCCGPAPLWKPSTCAIVSDYLIELAEPDLEMKRIIELGLPLALGAMSEHLFHGIIVCFISNFMGTNTMVAYLLVHFIMRFTEDFASAVADAESTLCSHALSTGDWVLAGKYAQLSMILHLMLHVPLLVVLRFFIDDLIHWLVGSMQIGAIGMEFTEIIMFYYLLKAYARTVSVLFQLTGHDNFEAKVSVAEGILSVVTICSVVATVPNIGIQTVAWIQLGTALGAFFFKMAYALYQGWVNVFWNGISSFALRDFGAIVALIRATLPLLFGAFLEYGEWELLIFFIAYLGPAEVVTWGLLGLIWKVLESSTEGIGEAAATRIAYHLGSGNPLVAQHASNKALFAGTVQSLFITSIIFMFGKNIASLLTTDVTLQNMINHVITELAVGNIVMNFALNTWSLVGAQGRYRVATLIILLSRWFVTIPMALVCIFAFRLDLNATMGSVIIGFATSVLVLGYVYFRSDWERLSRILQELQAIAEPDFSFADSDEDDDDSDEDDEDEDEDSEIDPGSFGDPSQETSSGNSTARSTSQKSFE